MKEFYQAEDGRKIPVAEVKAMSDEEFKSTLSEQSIKFLTEQPALFASFRAHAIGDYAERDRLMTESGLDKMKVGAAALEATGAAPIGGGKEKLLGLLNELETKLRAIIAKNDSGVKTFGSHDGPNTPEEKEQLEAFKEKGLDLHFTSDNFGILLNLLDDAHSWIATVINRETAKDEPDEIILNEAEKRHAGLHVLNDFLGSSMEPFYPALVKRRSEIEKPPADAPIH